MITDLISIVDFCIYFGKIGEITANALAKSNVALMLKIINQIVLILSKLILFSFRVLDFILKIMYICQNTRKPIKKKLQINGATYICSEIKAVAKAWDFLKQIISTRILFCGA